LELVQSVVATVRALELGKTSVAAISVAAELGMALIDGDGQCLTPMVCWADRRAVDEAEGVRRQLGDSSVYRLSRRPIDPELSGIKAVWWRTRLPLEQWSCARLVSIKDYIVFWMCGALATDESHASYSMLFDIERRQWSPELVRTLGISEEQLPEVLPATSVLGGLRHDAATSLGLRPGLPVAVGGPDGTVGMVGAGLTRAGTTVDLSGTADVVFTGVEEPPLDDEGVTVVNAHIVPRLWVAGGPTGTTGGFVAWLFANLKYVPSPEGWRAFDEDAESAPVGSGGVYCIPTMAGSRFPRWKPELRASLGGVSLGTPRGELGRAALEGCAFLVADGLRKLRSLGLACDAVRLVGGGARSQIWTQIRADMTGTVIDLLADSEATTLGAAMIAAVAGGWFDSLGTCGDAWISARRRVSPVSTSVAEASLLMERYTKLWDSLGPSERSGSRVSIDDGD
jgi:sugar (pentulose or hexulose) kinase